MFMYVECSINYNYQSYYEKIILYKKHIIFERIMRLFFYFITLDSYKTTESKIAQIRLKNKYKESLAQPAPPPH